MLTEDETRITAMASADYTALDELLAGKEPMYISPTDVLASTLDGSKLKLKPGETVRLACLDHPFVLAYGEAAQISLRSILAQSGLDIHCAFDQRRYQMGIELTNYGPNTFFSNHPFPVGAAYLPGDTLDYATLMEVARQIKMREEAGKSAGVSVLYPDSVPGITTAALSLPVVYKYGLAEQRRSINLAALKSGADREYVSRTNGTSALPITDPKESALAAHDIRISSSARIQLPPGVALRIREGVRYTGREVQIVRHTQSDLVKADSTTNNGERYPPHRIRFETYGPILPDVVICEAHAYQYTDF